MRLWSLHPVYLDRVGLTALWREGLLARTVLLGQTRGYRNHPQLQRFQDQPDPVGALQAYLRQVLDEARRRGYRFDAGKIGKRKKAGPGLIPVSRKQLDHEFHHLKSKLKTRAPAQYQELAAIRRPRPHPLFRVTRGPVASWEKTRG